MRMRATAIVVMLLAMVFIAHYPVPVIAQAHPSLATDQALYTLRDKQILLQGDGYAPKRDYVVWVQMPLDNSTRNSGLTFATTDKGQVPPATSLQIDPSSPLGTYLVSI